MMNTEQKTTFEFFGKNLEENVAETYLLLGDMAGEIKESIVHPTGSVGRLQVISFKLQQAIGMLTTAVLDADLMVDELEGGDKVKHKITDNGKSNNKKQPA